MKYSQQLKHKKWKSLRLSVINRDGNKCTECGSKEKLHVHHCKYIPNAMAWQVPMEYLITLCQICHNKLHETVSSQSLVDNTILPVNHKINKRKKSKINDVYIEGKPIRITIKKLRLLASIDNISVKEKTSLLKKEAKEANKSFGDYVRQILFNMNKHN